MNNKYILLIISYLALMACRPEDKLYYDDNSDEYPKLEFTKNIFDKYYLWYKTLPTKIIYENYEESYDGINKWIDDVKYEKDKWSFVISYSEYLDYYQNGESSNWDAFFFYSRTNGNVITGQDYILYVRDVQKEGPFGLAGAKRGDMIVSINGTNIDELSNGGINKLFNDSNSLDFGFYKNGKITTKNIAKSQNYKLNTVLKDSIYNINGQKIGYLAFSEFIEKSKSELANVFASFKLANVSDVILDMRYNTGGQVDVAEYMCNIFAGNANNKKLMSSSTHNDKNKASDEHTYFSRLENGLDLDRLFVITTNKTASASELVINSLEPYIKVLLIGSTTHGKPVGMEPRYSKELDCLVAPITFSDVNANGEGNYFEGLPVDKEASDNYAVDWGDTNDNCIHQALYYIENGTFEKGTPIAKNTILGTKTTVATRQKAQGMIKLIIRHN
ncbi:MAG: S41 family peptidase [Bacteroidales bacterium]